MTTTIEDRPPDRRAQDGSSRDAVGASTLELLDVFPAYTDLIWEKVLALVEVRGRVLEMGCGIGSISRRILQSPAVEALDAVDPCSEYVARVVREIGDPRFRAIRGSAEDFCPGDALYDRIVCINVLEHVEDDLAALRNFRRMLRPGGVCLLMVPAHPFLFSSLDLGLSHHRRYAKGALLELARAAGLEPGITVHFNPLGALGWWLNGRVLHRSAIPAGHVSIYARFLIQVSRVLDRLNPFDLGISLISVLQNV